jgi:hypothetical protein
MKAMHPETITRIRVSTNLAIVRAPFIPFIGFKKGKQSCLTDIPTHKGAENTCRLPRASMLISFDPSGANDVATSLVIQQRLAEKKRE